MTNSSDKKSKKKTVNIGNSPSLTQGNKFDSYQNKIKKNLEKNDKLFISEGFGNMNGLNLSKNGLTEQTKRAINTNSISDQEQQTLSNLNQEYQNTLTEYENLLSQISGSTGNYFNRVNPNNPYLGKNVCLTGGACGYVTQQGVFKWYPADNNYTFNNTAGKNGCPNTSYIQANGDGDINNVGSTISTTPQLIVGSPMQAGQSCGSEGSNIYVDQLLPSNVSPSYMGCYASSPNNDNMTFIGGSPPPPEGSLQNGNFTQPQISNNSYQYISSNSTVPGWNFYAVLINNSSAWGYPMPYPAGSQAACIQATQIFGQWIQLNSGTYTLTFSACGRPGYSGANTINVYCGQNGAGGTSEPTIYTFTPPTTAWQNYTTTFNITQSGKYAFGFYGTINDPNNSTAIQNISLTSTGSTSAGSYTYSDCEQAAINSGYQYFALQNVNPTTSTGYCAVSNSQPAITQYGNSTVPSQMIALWSSNTSGQTGNTATLTNQAALSVINSGGQSVFNTPNSNAQPSNYLGTYQDCVGGCQNRAMFLYNGGSQQYDLQQCQQIAQQNNYSYFALQNSTSGTNAQCTLSNDFSQASQWGPAGNFTAVNGYISGGGASNSIYNNSSPSSNYFLILQDDGNMVIYRGTSPNDNQGFIWASETNGQLQQANPQYAASNGKYGQNWISSGQTLAAGDWVGSTTGNMVLIMQTDGNLVLYTFAMQSNCQTMNDGNMGGGVGGNATYNIGVTAIPGNTGKLAYIDANSEAHLYPSSNQTYSNNYTNINGINTPGNDIPGAMFTGATVESCTTACNNNPDCAGFIFGTSGGYCWPKTNSMYPYGGPVNSDSNSNLYIRTQMPESPPLGVSQNTNNTDTVTYQNYVNGGAISSEYGLSQATSVQQQQLSQMQQKMSMLAQQINTLNNKFGTGVNTLQNQSKKNVSGLNTYLSNLIQTNENIVKTTENNEGNFQNILSDSDIVVLQKNYSYLVWSILAAGAVLITMNITKK